MNINQILKLNSKKKSFSKGTVYDFTILDEICEDVSATYYIQKYFKEFKALSKDLYKLTYKEGYSDSTTIEILFYKEKPIVIYEVYKRTSYLNITYLDIVVFEVISNIKAKLYLITNEYVIENSEIKWLDRYIVINNLLQAKISH